MKNIFWLLCSSFLFATGCQSREFNSESGAKAVDDALEIKQVGDDLFRVSCPGNVFFETKGAELSKSSCPKLPSIDTFDALKSKLELQGTCWNQTNICRFNLSTESIVQGVPTKVVYQRKINPSYIQLLFFSSRALKVGAIEYSPNTVFVFPSDFSATTKTWTEAWTPAAYVAQLPKIGGSSALTFLRGSDFEKAGSISLQEFAVARAENINDQTSVEFANKNEVGTAISKISGLPCDKRLFIDSKGKTRLCDLSQPHKFQDIQCKAGEAKFREDGSLQGCFLQSPVTLVGIPLMDDRFSFGANNNTLEFGRLSEDTVIDGFPLMKGKNFKNNEKELMAILSKEYVHTIKGFKVKCTEGKHLILRKRVIANVADFVCVVKETFKGCAPGKEVGIFSEKQNTLDQFAFCSNNIVDDIR